MGAALNLRGKFKTAGSTKARNVKERFEEVFNVRDFGAVHASADTAAGTFHTALEAAYAAAIASSQNETKIVIPPGRYRMGLAGAQLVQEDASKHIVIEGAGSRATTIVGVTSQVNMFEIGTFGNSSATKTRNITIRGMQILAGGSHAGACFKLRNCSDIEFNDIFFGGNGKNGFSLGVGDFDNDGTPDWDDTGSDDTISDNDCLYIRFTDCGGAMAEGLAGTMFEIGSAGAIQIAGNRHRYGSSGAVRFIRQTDPTSNCDGLYVRDVVAENFATYLDVVGQGVSNIVWSGGQIDRGTGGFNLAPAASGLVRGAIFANISVRGVGGDFLTIDASAASAQIDGVVLVGNDIYGVDGHVVDCIEGSFIATGNYMRNCGEGSGTSLFYIGADGVGEVYGNVAQNDVNVAPSNAYTYGIEWAGTATRSSMANKFRNFATAPTNGSNLEGQIGIVGPFTIVNAAAATTGSMLFCGLSTHTKDVMPARGRILRWIIATTPQDTVSAGTVTCRPSVNGSSVATASGTITSSVDYGVGTSAAGVAFNEGDQMGLSYTTSADFAPTTQELMGRIVVVFD